MVKLVALLLVITVAMPAAFSMTLDDSLFAAAYGMVSYAVATFMPPSVNLQGVGPGGFGQGIPNSVSFVRSDISTYLKSLEFFSDSNVSEIINAVMIEIFGRDASSVRQGSIIIDGLMRFPGIDYVDGFISMPVSFSFVISGSAGSPSVLEGEFIFIFHDDFTVEAVPADIVFDSLEYTVSPVFIDLSRISEFFYE